MLVNLDDLIPNMNLSRLSSRALVMRSGGGREGGREWVHEKLQMDETATHNAVAPIGQYKASLPMLESEGNNAMLSPHNG